VTLEAVHLKGGLVLRP